MGYNAAILRAQLFRNAQVIGLEILFTVEVFGSRGMRLPTGKKLLTIHHHKKTAEKISAVFYVNHAQNI